jgi:glycosyltransferase involved in cell wall biosynthesis
MKICVIIPTYNEAREIGRLVKEIKAQGLDVLVVDDGSSDNTYRIAEDSGAQVLRNTRNQGKGASLIKGFNYALTNNFDAVVTMDGDGQHLTQDIACFSRLANRSNSGFLIGNRMQKTKTMPALRSLTNRFMSWLLSSLMQQEVPDTQCGLRLIRKEVLEKVKLSTWRYETESEILLEAARLGVRIESVPIETIYNHKKSRINPFTDTLRFIGFLAKRIWTAPL